MNTLLLRDARLVQDGCITPCDILIRGQNVESILPARSGAAADCVCDLKGRIH